jgi:response regulator RpfG family c-di-GMP phosphodiesterase
MMEAAATKKNLFHNNIFIIYLETVNEEHCLLYMEWQRELTTIEKHLISIFSTNINIAFENISLQNEINDTQREVIYTLTETIEERSEETASHTERVSACAKLIAEQYESIRQRY